MVITILSDLSLIIESARSRRSPPVQPVAEPFRLPPADGLVVEGEAVHPGGELAREGDDGAPELILRERVQRQVRQACVLGQPDPVLATGPRR